MQANEFRFLHVTYTLLFTIYLFKCHTYEADGCLSPRCHIATVSRCTQATPEFAFPDGLVQRLHACLSESVCYDEMTVSFSRLQQDSRDYLALLKHYKLPVDDSFQVMSHEAYPRYLLLVVSNAKTCRTKCNAVAFKALRLRARHLFLTTSSYYLYLLQFCP